MACLAESARSCPAGVPGCPDPRGAHGQPGALCRACPKLGGFRLSCPHPESQTAARRGSSLGTGQGQDSALACALLWSQKERTGLSPPGRHGHSWAQGLSQEQSNQSRAQCHEHERGLGGPCGSPVAQASQTPASLGGQLAAQSSDLFGSRRGVPPDPLLLWIIHAPLAGISVQPGLGGSAAGFPGLECPARHCVEGGRSAHPNPPNPKDRLRSQRPALPRASCPAWGWEWGHWMGSLSPPRSASGQASSEGSSRWQRLLPNFWLKIGRRPGQAAPGAEENRSLAPGGCGSWLPTPTPHCADLFGLHPASLRMMDGPRPSPAGLRPACSQATSSSALPRRCLCL